MIFLKTLLRSLGHLSITDIPDLNTPHNTSLHVAWPSEQADSKKGGTELPVMEQVGAPDHGTSPQEETRLFRWICWLGDTADLCYLISREDWQLGLDLGNFWGAVHSFSPCPQSGDSRGLIGS